MQNNEFQLAKHLVLCRKTYHFVKERKLKGLSVF